MEGKFRLNQVHHAEPFIWGSLVDVSGLDFVYAAQPFLVVASPPRTNYTFDNRGRLTGVVLTNTQSVQTSYDDSGNRTSVVTTV